MNNISYAKSLNAGQLLRHLHVHSSVEKKRAFNRAYVYFVYKYLKFACVYNVSGRKDFGDSSHLKTTTTRRMFDWESHF